MTIRLGLIRFGIELEELIKELCHPLCRFNIGMCLSRIFCFLHAGPRQEKGEVISYLTKRGRQGLPSFNIFSKQRSVVRNNDEPSVVANHQGGSSECFNLSK